MCLVSLRSSEEAQVVRMRSESYVGKLCGASGV